MQKLDKQLEAIKDAASDKLLLSQFLSNKESAPSDASSSTEKQKLSVDDLMQLIKEGKTPPDVRQIDDKPPNPNAPIAKGEKQRPLKVTNLRLF